MALFTKTDDGTTVTYTGITGTAAEGQTYIITKDTTNLIIKTTIPNASISNGQTWQQIVATLDLDI